MRCLTRRNLVLGSMALREIAAYPRAMQHLRIDGEWCFVGTPERMTGSRRAVILFDGNGTTVGPDSSSWEKNAACTALSQAILDSGMLAAQSNRTANPDNGMWANAASQRAILALMTRLVKDYEIRRFSAITVSAGGATLLNLLLDGKAAFDAAALFAPVVSLESMYRCPGGFDRVKGIAEAYGFQPTRGCPGDPEKDLEFRRATEGFDPMRRIRLGFPRDWAGMGRRGWCFTIAAIRRCWRGRMAPRWPGCYAGAARRFRKSPLTETRTIQTTSCAIMRGRWCG
jgi:hypothetical protein